MSLFHRSFAITVFFGLTLIGCQQNPDIEKQEIKAIMSSMREAHFKQDADQFLEPLKDSFLEVRNGRYVTLKKSVSREGLQSYFQDMEFLELEDIQAPIIEISGDASMASYTASIIVKGYYQGRPQFSKLAWQSILKRIDGQWKIVSNVNTSLKDSLLGLVVLKRVKHTIGILADTLHIRAKANCTGPTDPFETLVLSSSTSGRMEQLSSDGHLILQHSDKGSWMNDLQKDKLTEVLDEGLIAFIKGHEFHWLSFRPQDRLKDPRFKGYIDFDGRTAFQINFKDPLARTVIFYYDFESYRPLGFDYPSHREDEMIRSHFSDWSEVDGRLMFRKVIIDEGDNKWEYDFTEIKINGAINSDLESKNALIDPDKTLTKDQK